MPNVIDDLKWKLRLSTLLAVAAWFLPPASAWAVIEPQSSPADIAKQVDTIGAVRVVEKNDRYETAGSTKWIKGADKELESLTFSASDAPTFAKSLQQSRGQILIVAARFNSKTSIYLLAGNAWFELHRRQTGFVIRRNEKINWFFGAGVDVLQPALEFSTAHVTAKFPKNASEKWRQVTSVPIDFQPQQLRVIYDHKLQADRLLVASDTRASLVAWRGNLSVSETLNREAVSTTLKQQLNSIDQLKLIGDATPGDLFGEDLASVAFCDLNRDGKLEFFTADKTGCRWLVGDPKSGFTDRSYACGFDFSKLTGVTDLLMSDRNGDGYEDLVVLFADKPPQVFRNMGFGCFQPAQDWAAELKLKPAPKFGAVVFGGKEHSPRIALASSKQSILICKPVIDFPATTLTIALPPGSERVVQITASDNGRSLGARILSPDQAARFTKANKGPLDITWRNSNGEQRKKRIILLRPTTWELPAE